MRRLLAVVSAVSLTFSAISVGPASAQTDWTSKVDPAVLDAASLGETDFIVYMAAKADLAPAAGLGTKEAKGAYVYEALTSVAGASQAGLVSQLASASASYQHYWITNAVVTSGDLALVQAVASRTDVKNVFPVGKGRLDPPVAAPGGTEAIDVTSAVGPSIGHVNADEAWSLGYRGQGVVVANADTGVRWTHDALNAKYRGWDAASGSGSHDYNCHDAIKNPNFPCATVGGSPEPCDDDAVLGGGHGTHTMGTIVGDDGLGNQIGMAPGARG